MLKDLKILNGEMALDFDSLNTNYTVNVVNDDKELKYEYKIDDGYSLSVYGNNLEEGLNEVIFTVYNDKEQMSYYFKVYKEKTTNISMIDNNQTTLNVSADKPALYVAPSIGVVCFLFILLFFTLLFKKNKKY